LIVNAEETKTHLNRRLLGPSDIDPVAWCLERLNGQYIPKNRILVVSMILEASPGYFRPGQAGSSGLYFPEKLEPWVTASVDWLRENYESNIINATLHLDETTPHIHVLILPLDSNNRLNSTHYFSPDKRIGYNSSYFQKIKDLGFSRSKYQLISDKYPKLISYYPYVNYAHVLNLSLTPINLYIPKLPNLIARIFPENIQKFTKNIILNDLKDIDSILTNNINSLKHDISAIKRLNLEFDLKQREIYKRVKLSLTNFKLAHDVCAEKWLKNTPWIKPLNVTTPQNSQISPPTPKRAAKTRAKNYWTFHLIDGDYQIDEDLTIALSHGYWRDWRAQVQGQGAVAFFSYLFNYKDNQLAQILKIIANDKKTVKYYDITVKSANMAMSRYDLGFMASKMAMYLDNYLKNQDLPWPEVKISQDKIQAIQKAKAEEMPPFYLAPLVNSPTPKSPPAESKKAKNLKPGQGPSFSP
jgi:hypothetical protein